MVMMLQLQCVSPSLSPLPSFVGSAPERPRIWCVGMQRCEGDVGRGVVVAGREVERMLDWGVVFVPKDA